MADAPKRILANGLGCYGEADMGGTEYIRADIARADADLAVAEAIRRAAEEADSFAKQSVSDAAFWRKDGMPKTAVVSEEHAKAARLVSAAIHRIAPAEALAEVQRLRARVTSLSEQVDTIAEQRDAALARVEKLQDTIRKAANRLDWCAVQLDDEAMIQSTIWADEARAALDEDARHG